MLIKMYLPFIQPVLEYANIISDICTLQESHLLETVQIEATRITTQLLRTSPKTNLYKDLSIEPLQVCWKNHTINAMYKVLNSPQYLADLTVPYLSQEPNYNLRSTGHNWRFPQCRTITYSNSFIPSTIQVWNPLPENIKSATSLETFKFALKSYRNQCSAPLYYLTGDRQKILGFVK